MTNILYILYALVILSVIVVAHEFGHYLAGRMCGIGIEEFSVGFGPKLLGFRKSGIQYSLRAIMMGGYCRFVGEDKDESAPNAMNNQAVWKRFVTILSGPVFNFALAFLAVVMYVGVFGLANTIPKVASVTESAPAQEAGLLPGDVIAAIDGIPLELNQEGTNMLRQLIGEANGSVTLMIQRGDETISVALTPRLLEGGRLQIGIVMDAMMIRVPATEWVPQSVQVIQETVTEMLTGLKNLFFKGEGLQDTRGPVGIIDLMSVQMRDGFDAVLRLIVLISLNLGILNLLPFPGLDGGRLIFLVLEGIRRKPVPPKYEGMVHAIGLMVLVAAIVVFTYKDVARMITGG